MSNAWGKVSSDESDEETIKRIEDLYFEGKGGKQVCVCSKLKVFDRETSVSFHAVFSPRGLLRGDRVLLGHLLRIPSLGRGGFNTEIQVCCKDTISLELF